MDDRELCDQAISLKDQEETPAGTEQQNECGHNDAVDEVMMPREQSTGQRAIPR